MKRIIRKRYKIKPKKSLFKNSVFWAIILFLFLITAGLYFFVFFEKIQVNKIIIFGNKKVPTIELEGLISEKIKRKFLFGVPFGETQSIFLVNSEKIKKSILEKYPNIDTATIKRKFPDTITIDIKERKPFAILCEKTKDCFFLDENGVTFEGDINTIKEFPIVRQLNEEKIILGKEAVKKDAMDKIVKIQRNFEEVLKLKVEEFNISSPERLDVKNSEGWQIYFNIGADIDLQIIKLNLLLEKEISQKSRAGLKYIDLRFKDRVYYK